MGNRRSNAAATVLAAALSLAACGEAGGDDASQSGTALPTTPISAEGGSAFVADEGGETVHQVRHCVLATPKGQFDGPCERVEWGGPSFSIRRAGARPFLDGISEVVVEVGRPGEKATGSYRRGTEGDLVPAGALSFRDDCGCWVGRDFRVGAFPQPQ
ncbi:hypothetical protein SZ64_10080 [Erythrobacter sp. SG61-1L]|uniref:hypothetical protein n=1 Tax=Erythrobacter sp. SG61-1L TaxID=1603897 RepID=UPI0006C8F7F8|nr:hypothetical protein [Erythrobacter sp. SG61-1L]KPL68432.1 hypothetical protein SZ64_10080 [Erythrobacter sp. SG61-1L]